MNDVSWLKGIKDNCIGFLESIYDRESNYFKYSLSGDLNTDYSTWGLGNIVFAVKLLSILKKNDFLDENSKKELTSKILKFRNVNGYIYDPYITSLGCFGELSFKIGIIPDSYVEEVRRAETRQSYVALSLLGSLPMNLFRYIPESEKSIDSYLKRFDWSNPWHSASHFSHLLFFLSMNKRISAESARYDNLIRYSIDWMDRIQSGDDGCWYTGDVSLAQKINGAMKVLTGLHAAGVYDFSYPERLIDTALTGISDAEACSNFNISYVLYSTRKLCPQYRTSEVEDFLYARLGIYKKHYFPEFGGFSFYPNKANDIYYGKKITCGKKEPDIHGTLMFIWGISVINNAIDLGIDLDIPIN